MIHAQAPVFVRVNYEPSLTTSADPLIIDSLRRCVVGEDSQLCMNQSILGGKKVTESYTFCSLNLFQFDIGSGATVDQDNVSISY